MGKVIQIASAPPSEASTGQHFLDQAWAKLEALPGMRVRIAQKKLSEAICRSFLEGRPLIAEAPTGTGKTLAYLVGALAALGVRQQSGQELPLVVATATVGLQTQVLTGDIPKLVEAGVVSANSVVLAKGRGRYFCVHAAERALDAGVPSTQSDFFEEGVGDAAVELQQISALQAAWTSKNWQGDIDSYPTTVTPKAWKHVAASSATCLGHRCEFYGGCAYFASRRALSQARLIVANHDLVLSDLEMAAQDQDPLFSGSSYFVVFDEAHHLPDKAVEAAAATLNVPQNLADLPRLLGLSRGVSKVPDVLKALDRARLHDTDLDPYVLEGTLQSIQVEMDTWPAPSTGEAEDEATLQVVRFETELPPTLSKLLVMAANQANSLLDATQQTLKALKGVKTEGKPPAIRAAVPDLLYQAAGAQSLLQEIVQACDLLLKPGRVVRWYEKGGETLKLCVSPLEGADVLQRLLWGSPRAQPVLVSATLQDFGSFNRFKARIGAPENTRTMGLGPVLPYGNSTLHLVQMTHSPRQVERAQYEEELLRVMPTFIWKEEGTLILFPSKKLMQRALPGLKKTFPGQVLAQGDAGVKELVARHRGRIDAGEGSILCGLATMAEGLDLPGDYCTHVIICTVPFSVPTSPVEQTLQEELGDQYFGQRALPDALVKMVQMTGRLVRRESDTGRITVFDNRLRAAKWGSKILKALPRFAIRDASPTAPPLRAIAPSSSI